MSYIKTISISRKRGEKKYNVPKATLKEGSGIVNDAHAGFGHRQVSLLPYETIQRTRLQGIDINPGDFAENICTEGLDFKDIRIGTRIHIGGEVILEVSQIGKACHNPCRIYQALGDCAMPREGVFTIVLRGGTIQASDPVFIIQNQISVSL